MWPRLCIRPQLSRGCPASVAHRILLLARAARAGNAGRESDYAALMVPAVHASARSMTFPATSVSRWSRPPLWKVSRS
jgi:hypothetical protein